MFETVPSIQSSHCSRMQSDSYMLWLDSYILQSDSYILWSDRCILQSDRYIYIAIGWLYNLISINIFTTWLPYILHINKHISNYQ